MLLLSTMLFALALSLDGFGVGVAYGMRQIKIPWFSLLIVCLSSAFAVTVSMLSGHLLASLISIKTAERLGALILILIGCWILFQAWWQQTGTQDSTDDESPLMSIRIRPLGIVIRILREPAKADFDRSGVITGKEAVFLGFALAMDALGAGFGAAMAGFKPLITPILVALCKFFLISLGLWFGKTTSCSLLRDRFAFLPGTILILMGFINIL